MKEDQIKEFRAIYADKLAESGGRVKKAYEATEAVFIEKYGAPHYKNYQSFAVSKVYWPKVNN